MTHCDNSEPLRQRVASYIGWATIAMAAVGVAALHHVRFPTYDEGWVVACLEKNGNREYSMIPDEEYEIPVKWFVNSPYRFGDLESVCDILVRTRRNSGVRLCVNKNMWGDPIRPFTAEEIEQVKTLLKKRKRADLAESIYNL